MERVPSGKHRPGVETWDSDEGVRQGPCPGWQAAAVGTRHEAESWQQLNCIPQSPPGVFLLSYIDLAPVNSPIIRQPECPPCRHSCPLSGDESRVQSDGLFLRLRGNGAWGELSWWSCNGKTNE